MDDARRLEIALEGLHELAWSIVLAGQGVKADQVTPDVMYPPSVGELFRRQLAARAIALIEALGGN